MRRLIGFVTVVSLVFSLLGCSNRSDKDFQPVNFYYRNAEDSFFREDSVILAEVREIDINTNIQNILSLYFQGPKTTDYLSPFPNNLQVVSLNYDYETIRITLSEHISILTGISLSIACACLCATVFDLTECNCVIIEAQESLLDGEKSFVLNRSDLYILDTYSCDATRP